MGRIERSSLNFSSRMSSALNVAGAYMVHRARTWSRWL